MNTPTTDRRKFLALSGATAIVAGLQPQALLAADAPMSLAAFQSQYGQRFQFYDDSGEHQSNLWLYQVEENPIDPSLEQFSLNFIVWGEPPLPDGIYNVTTPAGETLLLNTELTREYSAYWGNYGMKYYYYRVICGLLQA